MHLTGQDDFDCGKLDRLAREQVKLKSTMALHGDSLHLPEWDFSLHHESKEDLDSIKLLGGSF